MLLTVNSLNFELKGQVHKKIVGHGLSIVHRVHTNRRMPLFQHYVSVHLRVPFQKYVRITFIRKNSVAYVKITLSVAVSLPFPFIRSNRIEFYFFVSVGVTVRKRQQRFGNGSADTDFGNGHGNG